MNYDSWKSTDPTWESHADRARCAHVLYREIGEAGQYRYDRPVFCDVPYEEHDDEIMGHLFVMPEPEGEGLLMGAKEMLTSFEVAVEAQCELHLAEWRSKIVDAAEMVVFDASAERMRLVYKSGAFTGAKAWNESLDSNK